MDAGTGFTSQVYELSPYFLHKVSPADLFCIAHLSFSFVLQRINGAIYFNIFAFVALRNG